MTSHIAVIPARGGSKRIPKKNIKNFRGVPILGQVLSKVAKSNLFDRVVVSTDDEAIADVARQFGADVPFLRSSDLSTDNTPTVPVVKDTLQRLYSGELPDFVTAIYPCAPFISMKDVECAFDVLVKSDASYVFPVCQFSPPPQRGLVIDAKNRASSIYPQFAWTRSQDLDPIFFDVGQFYCGHAKSWIEEIELHNHSRVITLPPWRAVDIDTVEDWTLAELLHETIENKSF